MNYVIYSNSDELYHHGVKGMKWGVRHDPERSNRHLRAAYRSQRDANNLRSHGYHKEADAVQRVADHQRVKGENKQNMNAAKKDYRAAKKAYNKAFNKWSYSIHNSPIHITKKGKHANEVNFQNALVAAGELGIKQGTYMQAKGVAKNNPKIVAKGRHIVATASNTKKYNVKVSSLINQGYSHKEAHKQLSGEYERAINRQRKEDARYKKERDSFKKG